MCPLRRPDGDAGRDGSVRAIWGSPGPGATTWLKRGVRKARVFRFRKAHRTGLPPRACADLGKGEPYSSTVELVQRRIGRCGLLPAPLRADALGPFVAEQIETAACAVAAGAVQGAAPRRPASRPLVGHCWRRRCGEITGSAAACRIGDGNPAIPARRHLSGSRSPPARRRRSPAERDLPLPLHPSPQRRCLRMLGRGG